jgi:hypothetical protein
MKASSALVSRVCTVLGLPSAIVAESLGITKPDRTKIAALTTTQEVLDAMGEVSEFDCEASELLYKQWYSVAIQEAFAAKNVDEARKVYDENKCDTENISVGCLIALVRWDKFSLTEVRKAKTREEILEAGNRSRHLSRAEMLTDKKWDWLSLKEVREAVGVKALKRAHERARRNSPARRLAIRKIAELLDKKK